MADYERRLRPLKCALFAGGEEPAAEFAPSSSVGTAAVASAAPAAQQKQPGGGLAAAGSRILEISVGAAPNFPFFASASTVTALEPNESFFPLIREAAAANGLADRLTLVPGTAEQLPFESGSFDLVVGARRPLLLAKKKKTTQQSFSPVLPARATSHHSIIVLRCRRRLLLRSSGTAMVLCSCADVRAVTREIRRVLRPGGKFASVEHVAAPAFSPLWALQARAEPPVTLASDDYLLPSSGSSGARAAAAGRCRLLLQKNDAVRVAVYSEMKG